MRIQLAVVNPAVWMQGMAITPYGTSCFGMRKKGCNSSRRAESSGRGHGVGVRLLGQLVEEAVASAKETSILEHL